MKRDCQRIHGGAPCPRIYARREPRAPADEQLTPALLAKSIGTLVLCVAALAATLIVASGWAS